MIGPQRNVVDTTRREDELNLIPGSEAGTAMPWASKSEIEAQGRLEAEKPYPQCRFVYSLPWPRNAGGRTSTVGGGKAKIQNPE